MNNLIIKDNEKIENLIYDIRDKQVMLDSDLARLYGVETKRINEAVKRNLEKFPERFSWILNDLDVLNLRSQIATSSYGGRRYNPRVFTEQGVAMLATILKSQIATKVSIAIMDAFVLMRRYISTNLVEQKYINNQVLKNVNKNIIIVSKNIDEITKNKYLKQYNNITFINNDTFHDRFIIIDKEILYTSGSSFKDLGKKCFCISKIEDKEILNNILAKIKT